MPNEAFAFCPEQSYSAAPDCNNLASSSNLQSNLAASNTNIYPISNYYSDHNQSLPLIEQQVLHCWYYHPQFIQQLTADGIEAKQDFFGNAANQIVFLAFKNVLKEQPDLKKLPFDSVIYQIDILANSQNGFTHSVCSKARSLLRIFAGNPPVEADFSFIESLVKLLKNLSVSRQLYSLTQQAQNNLQNPEGHTSREILVQHTKDINQLLLESEDDEKNIEDFYQSFSQYMLDVQNGMYSSHGIPTGFAQLDELLRGLNPGLYAIAARPGVGKTTFALNLIANMAFNPNLNKPILFFELEMSKEEIFFKYTSLLAKASIDSIKDNKLMPSQWKDIMRQMKQTCRNLDTKNEYSMMHLVTAALTIDEINAKAQMLYQKFGGLSAVFIDYLQLIKASQDEQFVSLNEAIGNNSEKLKRLSLDLNIPVIALCQLNREIEKRGDQSPRFSDLRNSGKIEQDSDVVISLSAQKSDSDSDSSDQNLRLIKLAIMKNRHGPLGEVDLKFYPEINSFQSL